MTLQLPQIPEDEKTPLVQLLLRIVQEQAEQIALLKDEIARLKGQKPRPKFPPSRVSEAAKGKPKTPEEKASRSSSLNARRPRRKEERVIKPNSIPAGSRFKGYEDYYVQDLRIESVEIQFRLAVYVTPEGERIRGDLPSGYNIGHFSAELQAFCLSQHYQCHVTGPLLLEQLYEMGIDISSAELNNILIHGKERFHNEKDEIRDAGVRHSEVLNVDDTSARHQGKNGICTAIGSRLFSYFESTDSKSRVNFLRVLLGADELYAINEECLNYVFENEVTDRVLDQLETNEGKVFSSKKAWETFLNSLKISGDKDVRVATEAALIGGAMKRDIDFASLLIMSDAAPQFVLFLNGLCWVHEERHYRKLIAVSESERLEIEKIRGEIWDFYMALKEFKIAPSVLQQTQLTSRFDRIFGAFGAVYQSEAIKELMANTRSRKDGLLRVLKFPQLPLHNNDCERDIREYAKRRKVSGSTRSDAGRRARDTFTSLKKTCQKHCISFWRYVVDRLSDQSIVPRLADLISQAAQTA